MQRPPHDPPTAPWTVARVHAAHADFVWASLFRMGVRTEDLPDQLQEVFMVVHRRLDSFDGSSRMTTWLYGICLRVASEYRRHRRRHPETLVDQVPEDPDPGSSPERSSEARQARALAARMLEALDADKRAVFVMYEIEEIPCREIADELGVPVGTVHSRLHAARQAFAKALEQWRESHAHNTERPASGRPDPESVHDGRPASLARR